MLIHLCHSGQCHLPSYQQGIKKKLVLKVITFQFGSNRSSIKIYNGLFTNIRTFKMKNKSSRITIIVLLICY